MMSRSSGIICVMVMCMVVMSGPAAEAAISCGTVASSISPCLAYAKNGGVVTAACCTGVKGLYSAAATTADRQTACKCLKALTGGSSSMRYAAGIPAKCGVRIPYKIAPTTDCSKVV